MSIAVTNPNYLTWSIYQNMVTFSSASLDCMLQVSSCSAGHRLDEAVQFLSEIHPPLNLLVIAASIPLTALNHCCIQHQAWWQCNTCQLNDGNATSRKILLTPEKELLTRMEKLVIGRKYLFRNGIVRRPLPSLLPFFALVNLPLVPFQASSRQRLLATNPVTGDLFFAAAT